MQKDLRNEGGDFVNSCISDVSGSAFFLGRVQPVIIDSNVDRQIVLKKFLAFVPLRR